jgi:hypothetical protein
MKVCERRLQAARSASVSTRVTIEFERIGISRFFSSGFRRWPV